MSTRRGYDLECPIARALDRVGDRWTLLILRDLHAGPARIVTNFARVFVWNHHTRQIVPDELDCWRITTTMARRFCLGVNK